MKISRNEPCPCGSGLKYKRCCNRNTGSGVDTGPQDAPETTTRTVGRETIKQAFHEIDTMSGAKLRRKLDNYTTTNPVLMMFVATTESALSIGEDSDTILDVMAIFRIFEKHYGRPSPPVQESEVTRFLHENGRSFTRLLSSFRPTKRAPRTLQPFVLDFIVGRLASRAMEEGLDPHDIFALFMLMKTIVDVLDKAYNSADANQAATAATTAPA